MPATRFVIEPEGPFSLQESALFGFGHRHDTVFDGRLRLAFCLDGYQTQVGVAVSQRADGVVECEVSGQLAAAEVAAAKAQVARVLSLDYDARGFVRLGERDPVFQQLLAAAPGLRPPLFHSPYEAALWAILSTRRPSRVAARVRQKLAQAAGTSFEIAGRTEWSVPLPAAIVALGVEGLQVTCQLDALRAERLVGVAQAALRGELDAETLRDMDPDAARQSLRRLPGIGPFYAELILIRASGTRDVLASDEPNVLAMIGELYGLGAAATSAQAIALGRNWAPWRTWACVLLRAAGSRVLNEPRSPRPTRTARTRGSHRSASVRAAAHPVDRARAGCPSR